MLSIRCPACGQRFNVEQDLRGRVVECGECDERFEITESIIVKGRKFYPGEHRDPLLDHVFRVDRPIPPVNDLAMTQAYAAQATPTVDEPNSPLRVIMGLAGVFGMIITALILVLGADRGGVLDGMTTDKRLVVAAFAGLFGSVLVVLSNPKKRLLALIASMAMAVGMLSLPLIFTGGSKPLGSDTQLKYANEEPELVVKSAPSNKESELREIIGTDPLVAEIARLDSIGSDLKAVGLWLKNLKVRNCLLVRDYILRETNADLQSHYYPRDNGDFLMVVTGIKESADQLAIIAAALGNVENVYSDLSVVQVTVDNERFLAGPIDQLSNPEDPDFYLLNRIELESIDPDRVAASVKRLADVEPKLFRKDITERLIRLLGNKWILFKSDICRALLVWSDEPGRAGEVVLKEIEKMVGQNLDVPEEMIALSIKEQAPGTAPILHKLWLKSPVIWERYYINLGKDAEKNMLGFFDQTTGSFRQSAIRILGSTGGAESLDLMRKISETTTEVETKILIRNAIRSISERMKQGE